MECPIYEHIVDYYVNNKVIKSSQVSTGVIIDAEKYWENILKQAKDFDNSFVSVGKYKIVSKCSSNYQYSVQSLKRI